MQCVTGRSEPDRKRTVAEQDRGVTENKAKGWGSSKGNRGGTLDLCLECPSLTSDKHWRLFTSDEEATIGWLLCRPATMRRACVNFGEIYKRKIIELYHTCTSTVATEVSLQGVKLKVENSLLL